MCYRRPARPLFYFRFTKTSYNFVSSTFHFDLGLELAVPLHSAPLSFTIEFACSSHRTLELTALKDLVIKALAQVLQGAKLCDVIRKIHRLELLIAITTPSSWHIIHSSFFAAFRSIIRNQPSLRVASSLNSEQPSQLLLAPYG